jgi:hypothetical protein
MKRLNECSCGCGGTTGVCGDKNANYMFFGNLKTIKKYVDAMLQMDPRHVQRILSNGHDWAADHIATSKDDIQEVGDFLMNALHDETQEVSGFGGNTSRPQFIPADFKDQLKQMMPERIEKTEAGYFATTKSGRRLSKRPKSKRAALKQLAAVEISKHKK